MNKLVHIVSTTLLAKFLHERKETFANILLPVRHICCNKHAELWAIEKVSG